MKITTELKEELKRLSGYSIPLSIAFDHIQTLIEGDYYYLIKFKLLPVEIKYGNGEIKKSYNLFSKDGADYMYSGLIEKDSDEYNQYKDHLFEVIDGLYYWKQDGDGLQERMNYWIYKRRDSKIDKILN